MYKNALPNLYRPVYIRQKNVFSLKTNFYVEILRFKKQFFLSILLIMPATIICKNI